jgi:hypothetical protein
MTLFAWQKKKSEGEDGKEEFTLPDELTKKIEAGAEAAGKIGKVETMLSDLLSIQKSEKEARDKAAKDAADAAAAAAKAKKNEDLDAELEELMLTNPREAIRRATEGQTNAIKAVHADNVRREVFEDAQKFKYYHGTIKAEVDALLASQSVDFRLNPQNIENTYNTIVGKHNDEIVEGKLKTRFAGSESGSRGTSSGSAGSSGTGGTEKKTLEAETEKEARRAARQVGIKYEDYVEMLEKEGVI